MGKLGLGEIRRLEGKGVLRDAESKSRFVADP